jgi:hypothetical protein
MTPILRPEWQKINAYCLFCHSWQDQDRRRITAMTTLTLILIASALIATFGYLAALIHGDGYGRRAASGLPRSHRPDVFEPRRLG